jgi:hypothetical protein
LQHHHLTMSHPAIDSNLGADSRACAQLHAVGMRG